MRPRTYVIEEEEHLDNLRKIIKRDFFAEDRTTNEEPTIKLSLNNYLMNFKSNENQFFSELVEADKEQWKKAHWWVGKQDKLMLLTNNKESEPYKQMLGEDRYNGVDHAITKQEALNGVFFNRDKDWGSYLGIEYEQSKKVEYENCRLSEQRSLGSIKDELKQRREDNLSYELEEIPNTPYLEGEESVKGEKQYVTIGGDKYSRVYQPMPEADKLQLMTWGNIESTPIRLSGPEFQIAEISEREQILNRLNNKINKEKGVNVMKKSELVNRILKSVVPSERSKGRSMRSLLRVDSVKRERVKVSEDDMKGLLDMKK